jgi:hypothetical protein
MRIPKAVTTLLTYSKVRRIASFAFFLNGILYLGVEIMYQYLPTLFANFFSSAAPKAGSEGMSIGAIIFFPF